MARPLSKGRTLSQRSGAILQTLESGGYYNSATSTLPESGLRIRGITPSCGLYLSPPTSDFSGQSGLSPLKGIG